MKMFLSLTLVFVTATATCAQESSKELKSALAKIVKKIERDAGKEPVKPIVEITADEVIITSNDIDQTKDAIIGLRPEDSKKSIRVVIPKIKPIAENGHPVLYSSFGKPLAEQFRDVLDTLADRSEELAVAREADRTGVRNHIAVAEKVLGLDATERSMSMRTLRITWLASFDHVKQDMTFVFE